MGPVLKSLTPVYKPITEYLKLGPGSEKYTVIIPGSLISGKGVYDNAQLALEANQAIKNIELALEVVRRENNLAHTKVLESMLKEAKEQRWSHVLSLARSSVGVLDSVKKVVESRPAGPIVQSQSLSSTTQSGSTINLNNQNSTSSSSSSSTDSFRNVFFDFGKKSSNSTSSASLNSSPKSMTTNSGSTDKKVIDLKSTPETDTVYVGKNVNFSSPVNVNHQTSLKPAAVSAPSLKTNPTTNAPVVDAPTADTAAPGNDFTVDKAVKGVINSIRSTINDETGRKQAEQKLKDKEEMAKDIKVKTEEGIKEINELEKQLK
jgi:hypothetical protein